MSWLWIGLLALAVLVLAGAEWPRLDQRFGIDARTSRRRRRRKSQLRVLTAEEDDDFAASVERDLSLLPTIEKDD